MARGTTTRTRRSTPDADDYQNDEPDSPRRGSSRRGRSEPEDEAPRGRAAASGSRRGRASEPDEAPRGRTRAASRRPAGDREKPEKQERKVRTGTSGWDAYEANRVEGGDYANEYKPTDEESIIKFQEEGPAYTLKQHWIERKGKRSWTCCEPDDPCPLCNDVGDKAQTKVGFNVIDLTNPDNPEGAIWIVGQQIADQLRNFGKDPKTGPLDREDYYYAVVKVGKGQGKVRTTLRPVKARDLAEDWETEPLTADELDKFYEERYTEKDAEYHTPKELEEIADEVLGN